ncbi:Type I restriction-modification system, specificity subunit S [Clostridiaceae bacterium BL-3]|nr:Type I restriction-modification system, specificity subunit S [Clostridiaceae bacterium BL-3]
MDKNKANVPKIRFPGFTDPWEQRKLKNIAEFNPKSTLPDEFEYVDLESVNGTDLISHRTEIKGNAPSRAQRLAKRGDVFYQTVRPYQKNNYLYDLPYDNYVFSTGYAQMRPNIDSYFLLSRLQEERFVKAVLDRSTGTSYPAINSNDLSEIEIKVPFDKDEQFKIGSLFRDLDNLITLHQRKLNHLKDEKKGLLQKMFPKKGENFPELRFPGFTDPWEQRKLKNIVDVKSGRDYKHLSEGKIPVYGTGGYMLSVNEALSYKEDAIGIGRKGTIDKPYILRAPFWTVDTLFYAVPENNNNLNFVYDIFQNIKWKQKDESTGVPSLSKTAINNVDVLIPDYKEQKQIGDFFQDIDHLITLHQRKLNHLQEQKKALLQQMFI